jgi:hypothetical protein
LIDLQFRLPTDYFLAMLKRGETPLDWTRTAAWRLAFPLFLTWLGSACAERDRLLFPSGPSAGDGVGPITLIDRPLGADTTVNAGPEFFVNGRTVDPDGVDTVYFFVIGGTDNIPPFRPTPASDTVRFGLPISTAGLEGDTIHIQVFGVDVRGNRGSTASRRIFVQ